jgi:hypothetical protein
MVMPSVFAVTREHPEQVLHIDVRAVFVGKPGEAVAAAPVAELA